MDGLLACFRSQFEADQRAKSKKIDRMLAKEKSMIKREAKILLLGAGESGKSTFLKQMRIIHGLNFGDEDISTFRTIIYSNVIKGCRVLIDARQKLGIPWENEEKQKEHAQSLIAYETSMMPDYPIFAKYADSAKSLWSDNGIKDAYDRRREFQLSDSVKYFLDEIDRINNQAYRPTTVDILHCRKATKGIVEHSININGVPFRFVDVGGQRSQRQKWFQCFTEVTSILFLVSSSEFDQVLLEDRRTNRLRESCDIFDTIVNNQSFTSVAIILFLNKTDLLEQKVKRVSIRDYFPEFQGDWQDLQDVQYFILGLFDRCRHDKTKPLFHHYTTAIDTENIKFVFQAVKATILQDNLKSLMLH